MSNGWMGRVAAVQWPGREVAGWAAPALGFAGLGTALTLLGGLSSSSPLGAVGWRERVLILGLLWGFAAVQVWGAARRADLGRELAITTQLTSALLDNAPDAILLCASDGTITRANHAAVVLFGYVEDELVGLNVDALVPASSRAQHGAQRGAFAQAPSVRPMGVGRSVAGVCKDGRTLELEVRLRPVTFGPSAVIVSARDVGVERMAQRRLQGVARMDALGRCTASVVHDLNNVLTIVQSHLAVARRTQHEARDVRADLVEVEAALDGACDLTRRLLSFSKGVRVEAGPVDVSRAVRDATHVVQPLLGAAVRVVVEAAGAPDWALVDRAQLDHALLNLLLNARDALPRGGAVHLRTAAERVEGPDARARGIAEGDYVRLSVEDTGIGMDAATHARLFEPFFTTKGKDGGTGLGLYSVREAVLSAGGCVDVRSAPGVGTCFDLWLPRCPAPA